MVRQRIDISGCSHKPFDAVRPTLLSRTSLPPLVSADEAFFLCLFQARAQPYSIDGYVVLSNPEGFPASHRRDLRKGGPAPNYRETELLRG
jgi:hypothetical protein